MILIADSGSTKTDWRLIDDTGKITQIKTKGLNPYYQDSETMRQELATNLAPEVPGPLESIFFYGAGCVTEDDKAVVGQALIRALGETPVFVYDDLLAAARASCGTDAGIACIIGTGSNSCLYDGESIIDRIPPLGFILGDEGSGSYIGKRLAADYLKRVMPPHIRKKFEERFSPDKDIILDRVYKKEYPNRFLAQYSTFAFHHLTDPYIYALVSEGFGAFFDRNILSYSDHQTLPVNFVGSIAYYYSDVLRQVAMDRKLLIGNIIESPIAGLTLYHQVPSG